MNSKTKSGKENKKTTLLRATKDKKLWRSIIINFLKGEWHIEDLMSKGGVGREEGC